MATHFDISRIPKLSGADHSHKDCDKRLTNISHYRAYDLTFPRSNPDLKKQVLSKFLVHKAQEHALSHKLPCIDIAFSNTIRQTLLISPTKISSTDLWASRAQCCHPLPDSCQDIHMPTSNPRHSAATNNHSSSHSSLQPACTTQTSGYW